MKMASLEENVKSYRLELAKNPQSKNFVALSEACRQLGFLDEAISVARSGLAYHPHYALGKLALARALFDNSDSDEARKHLEEFLRISDGNLSAMKLLAQIYFVQTNSEKCIPLLKRILQLDPADEVSASQLAELQERSNTLTIKSSTLATLYKDQGHTEVASAMLSELSSNSDLDFLKQMLKQIDERRKVL